MGVSLQKLTEEQKAARLEAKGLREQDLQPDREIVKTLSAKWAQAMVSAGPKEVPMPPLTEESVKPFLKEKYQRTWMKQIGEDLLSYLLQPKAHGDGVGVAPTSLHFGVGGMGAPLTPASLASTLDKACETPPNPPLVTSKGDLLGGEVVSSSG